MVRSWCVPEAINPEKRASADVHPVRVAGTVPSDCDDEYPDDVGEPSAACASPAASSRTLEPHMGEHGDQDTVMPSTSSSKEEINSASEDGAQSGEAV
ncbi:unnamed protein product [Pieris macdunnoughi]|uniref:Uncharacterized protein n=1 Tax=Pieris macdunnoughi TaxID=345717 RepID=A0A821Q702_9NEOP|nr:unnamed protein product [Pieris macdunnoughi]